MALPLPRPAPVTSAIRDWATPGRYPELSVPAGMLDA